MSVQTVDQRTRIHVLQIIAVAAVGVFLVAAPAFQGELHEFIELTGLALLFVCFGGRIWSILYVGGRKSEQLVTIGPYSITRNPLYLFSTIGAVGAGLAFGSLTLAAVAGLIAYAVMVSTARTEAQFLSNRFGAEYDAYAARTPLFWPRPSAYRDAGKVEFSTAALRRTFIDGLYFLAIFPVMEGIDFLRESGILPSLINLY